MRSKQVSVVREIRTLRSTWRGLETWHGRDAVTPRNRKSEATVNTNFDLNWRASLRPYLRGAGGETPPANSPTSMFARWKRYAKRTRWPKKTTVPPA